MIHSARNLMEKNHAKEQARAQLASIHEMVSALSNGEPYGEYTDEESIREAIQQDALEVLVRSNWAGSADQWEAEQFTILLCTGGPAVRIKGTLENMEPRTAQLEYQDWGTPWTRYTGLTDEDIDALLTYAGCFYFGD